MRNARKWQATLIALVLAITMIPLPQLSAATAKPPAARKAATAKSRRLKLKKSEVDTHSSRRGIRVRLDDAAANVASMDVYRSTAAGERGEKLNSAPVKGADYLDKTAKAGARYYYTVTVTRSTKKNTSRFRTPDVLPQVKADVIKPKEDNSPKRRVRQKHAVHKPRARRHQRHVPGHGPGAARGTRALNAEPASSVPPSLVKALTNISGPTTITVNTTWTLAGSPYFIRGGDLEVAPGVTLTIQPGVKVFFDTVDANTSTVETSLNPTAKCDLIVHGKLLANGTATAPILLSSAQASLEASQALGAPDAGAWGALFFDSKLASQISRCDIEFGEGIWAQGTARPYVLNNDIVNVNSSGPSKPLGAVYFENPVTDATTPQIKVTGNHIATVSTGVTIWCGPIASGNYTLAPNISGNVIKAYTGLDLEIWNAGDATSGNYAIGGTISSNQISVLSGGDYCVRADIDATGTGAATINPTLANNTLRDNVDDAVYLDAATPRGIAKITPVISGGSISSVYDGLDLDAYATEATEAVTGQAIVNPTISNTRIIGTNGYGVYLYADTGGGGKAEANPTITNTSLETASDNALYDYAESEYGPSSATPVVTNSHMKGHNSSEAVYIESYCKEGTGTAKANMVYTGGSIYAGDDDAVYNYAESSAGLAEAKPKFTSTAINAYDTLVYNYAYGDEDSSTASGGANASTTFDRCTTKGVYEYGVYDYAQDSGLGNATANPVVKYSSIVIPGDSTDEAIYNYAYAGYGRAEAKAYVLNSTLKTNDGLIYSEAYGDDSTSTASNTANASTTFAGSTGTATNDYGIYNYAYTGGKGAAAASPVITNSTIDTIYDSSNDAVYNYAESDYGRADAKAAVTGSEIRAYDDAIYSEAYSDDATTTGTAGCNASTTLVGSEVSSVDEYGVYNYAHETGTGAATASPVLRYSQVSQIGDDSDDAVYNEAESDYGNAAAMAVLYGTRVDSGYEDAVYSVASGADASATAAGSANASTDMRESFIYESDGYAVYNEADSGNAPAIASPYVYESYIRVENDYAVNAESDSSRGSATASPRVTDSRINSNYICVDADAAIAVGAIGNAIANPVVTRSPLHSTYYETIDAEAHNSGTGKAIASPIVTSSALTNDYDDAGFYVSVTNDGTGTAEAKPVLTNVPIMSEDAALDISVTGPGSTDDPAGESFASLEGTYTSCSFKTGDDSGADMDVSNYGGKGALMKPVFVGCTFNNPNDFAGEFYASGSGSETVTVTNATVISGGSALHTGDGFHFLAENNSSSGGSTTTTETVLCAPKIYNTPIYATWNDAVYSNAHSDGHGLAKNDALISKAPSTSYSGMCMFAGSDHAADVLNAGRVLGATSKTKLESFDTFGILSRAFSQWGNATDQGQYKDLAISSRSEGINAETEVSVSTTKMATADQRMERNTVDDRWALNSDGLYIAAISVGGANVKPVIGSNCVKGADGDGIYVNCNGSVTNTATPSIASNTVMLAENSGIDLDIQGAAAGTDTACSITRNTVSGTGEAGIDIDSYPHGDVLANKVSYSDYAKTESYLAAGIYWRGADGATVKGNMVKAGRYGISYEDCSLEPTTTYNSFADTTGKTNRPWNMWTNCPTSQHVNAEYNWWGYTASDDITRTIKRVGDPDSVDFTPWLATCRPVLTSLSAVKSGTKVKFTLVFDRPMDTSIKTLRFGKTSPYATYSVNGAWTSDGKTWKATRSRVGLPTGVWMYFSVAKDLPGTPMLSTSKKFKL